MRNKMLVLIAIASLGLFTLIPEPAEAQRGGFRGGGMGGFRGGMGGFRGGMGGFRGASLGGFRGGAFRGAGLGWRGGGVGFRRAGLGWGGGVGWRRAGLGWGWRRPFWGYGAAGFVGAGLLASSYGYGYGWDSYGYGGGYGGCVLEPRLVATNWGYQRVLVQACY